MLMARKLPKSRMLTLKLVEFSFMPLLHVLVVSIFSFRILLP